MSQVSVQIAGQNFRLTCDEGEEAHVAELAEQVDGLVAQVREQFPTLGELRLAIMASLTLADDNARLKKQVAEAQERLERDASLNHVSQEKMLEIFKRTTARVEDLTRQMENKPETYEGA
jgi:cell division protein ZapA